MQESSLSTITQEIDTMMSIYHHHKKDLDYGYRRTFANQMRFDIIDYKKKGRCVLRIGRGARLVRQHPILHDLFDEVATVIAKYEVHSVETLHHKHLPGLLDILHQAPHGIGVRD